MNAARKRYLLIRIAREMLQTQRAWRVSASTFTALIDITGPEWLRMKRGAPLPERRDTLLRVNEIRHIHSALVTLFNHRHERIARWLLSANTGTPFGGKTAMRTLQSGLPKMREVRMYLEYHAGGGW